MNLLSHGLVGGGRDSDETKNGNVSPRCRFMILKLKEQFAATCYQPVAAASSLR